MPHPALRRRGWLQDRVAVRAEERGAGEIEEEAGAGLFARSRSSRRGARSSPSTHSRTYRSGTEPRHVAFAPGATMSLPPSLRITPSARQCSASV